MKKLMMLIVALVMVLSAVACAATVTPPAPAEVPAETEAPAAEAPAAEAPEEAPAKFDYSLTMYTGSMGGSYYTIGTAMSEIFSTNIDGTTIGAASSSSGDNIGMLVNNEAVIAMAGAPDYVDVMGGLPTESADICSMGVFNQLASVIVVRADSSYQTIDDLVGKKIQVGAAGTGQSIFNLALLEASGHKPEDFKLEYMSQGDASEAFVEGKLEACFVFASLPASAVTQMTSSVPVRIIQLDDALLSAMEEKYPYYKVAEVTPEQVPDCGITAPYKTLTQFGELLVRSDLDENFVYTMTKVLFENYDKLIAAAPGAAVCTPENAVAFASFNLHPGAQRYLKEIGLL